MSWRVRQRQMIVELNEKVFSRDPLRVMRESYNSIDVVNSNYIKELKNREKYNPQDFDGSLIEKFKYDYLKNGQISKRLGCIKDDAIDIHYESDLEMVKDLM